MGPFETTISLGDVPYTFRLPCGQDSIDIDLKALELRKGVTEGMGNGYAESQNIAILSTLCKSPKDTDFSKMYTHEIDYLAEEVAIWSNSFRKNVGGKKTTPSP